MPMVASRAPYTLLVVDDDQPLNPREDYDNFGAMVCWHRHMVSGLRGIVDHVDDAAQIHCIWQNGSSLALIPGEDKFHIDAEQEQDIQPEEQSGELEL